MLSPTAHVQIYIAVEAGIAAAGSGRQLRASRADDPAQHALEFEAAELSWRSKAADNGPD